MSERQPIDELIESLVRKTSVEVPEALEARVRAAAREDERRARERRRVLRWSLIPAAAAALVLGVFVASPVIRRPAAPPAIAEIRTEFEIPGKDIKIVFFQKPDFKLFQED